MKTLLEQEMITYFMELNENDKKSFLQILKLLVENGEENSERVTIEQYNKEIDDALEGVKQGHYTTLEDVKKEMESW